MSDNEHDQVREWVAHSRAQQGLPPTVTDPVILDRVASIFRAARPTDRQPDQQQDAA